MMAFGVTHGIVLLSPKGPAGILKTSLPDVSVRMSPIIQTFDICDIFLKTLSPLYFVVELSFLNPFVFLDSKLDFSLIASYCFVIDQRQNKLHFLEF